MPVTTHSISMSLGLNAPDWEAIDLLSMATGATDVRGAPIDPIARRIWGVPVVLNQGLGDDVGLIIAQDAVTVDHEARWRSSGPTRCRMTSPRTRFAAMSRAASACRCISLPRVVKVSTAA